MVLNLLLAFSGGFQDAYTYIVRNHVFANAQTGNVVLMSTYFMEGEGAKGLRYLFPLIAFAGGVLIADLIENNWKHAKRLHWRQMVLVLEMGMLIVVGFLPFSLNMLANILVSFACAMQVQTFRTVAGNAYASTMCIGNLRNGTAALSAWLRTGDRADRNRMIYYFIVILVFATGAGVGGNVSYPLGIHAIWISAAILLIVTLIMELDRE